MTPTPATDRIEPGSPRVGRRQALVLLGGGGLALLAGCGSGSSSSEGATTTTSSEGDLGGGRPPGAPGQDATTQTTADGDAYPPIPEETAGPFPADGTNGPNVLEMDGIVRQDMGSNLGSSGVAGAVPLEVQLTVVDAASGDPLSGAAVYAWHCDAEGRYSQYDDVADDTFCRGVQEAGADGTLTFTTVFPGAYQGRWPHIHFEVFDALDQATVGSNAVRTSQLAVPEDVCAEVYGEEAAEYPQSAQNLDGTSLESDGIFSDGFDAQLAEVTGSVDDGYTAALLVAI